MQNPLQTQPATNNNLRQLGVIRAIALICQLLSLAYFTFLKPIGLPGAILSKILALYALVTLLTWQRSFWSKRISETEFFTHILIDVLFFSVLLFYSGGGTNPFVFYYLVPISISAVTLPRCFTLGTAALSLIAYCVLLRFHVQIPPLEPDHHHSGKLHLLGMWLNFCLSAALITYFVTQMAEELRRQEQAIARQRENRMVDEQILGIATLAAGTAHELSTPLNTMKILLEELKNAPLDNQSREDVQMLEQQIDQCRTTLQQLVKTASETTDQEIQAQPLRAYFTTLLERWQLLRPQTRLDLTIAASAPAIEARLHPTIAQALISLINNAADASPEKITVNIDWDQHLVRLQIIDYGTGFHPLIEIELNEPFTSSKPNGMGLGLFLTKATLNRFGGEVHLQSSPSGTTTTVTLKIDDE